MPLKPGERVLLVACGTGLDIDFIPPGVAITAIDITPSMVVRTRERARHAGRVTDALGPLLAAAGLRLIHTEPAGFGGTFVVASAEKADEARGTG